MKKLGVIVSLVFAVLLLASSFVSAQASLQPIADGAVSFYENIFEPVGKFVLGKNTDDGQIFFAKLLFFMLLIGLVNYALIQIPSFAKKSWWISAIVSILAIRWVNADWIEAIVMPYSALGITLTAFFPFVIYFFLVEKGLEGNTVMRKVAWVFAAVVFMGMFLYRNAASTTTTTKVFGFVTSSATTTPGFNPTYIYLIAAVASVILLVADKTIQKAFGKARVSNMMDKHKYSVEYDTTVGYEKIRNEFYHLTSPSNNIKNAANSKISTLNQVRKSVGLPEFDVIP